jgi:alkane 1-monooxygenase
MQVLAAYLVWRSGWGAVLPVACCVGLIGGALGVSVAHELGHSVYRFDRGLAWVLMCSVFYAQFMVEHYRGHHPRASTRRDPATARRGESLWQFLPRSIKGGTLHAWKLEARRLHQNRQTWGHSPLVWCAQANVLFVLAAVVALALPVLVFLAVAGRYRCLFAGVGQLHRPLWHATHREEHAHR